MGTPAVAVPVLAALLDEGHEVVGVYTQPDRPAGRGKQVAPTPVKGFAMQRGLRVLQPASLRRDEAARQELASLAPDIVVVAAYGLFIPADILDRPILGCLNVHPSLLPLYRGPAPVASAILSGDAVTGVTVMRVTELMDAGPIVAQQQTPIGPNDTTGALTERLFQIGADLLVEILPRWQRGEVQAIPQDESRATVTGRLSREDGEIDWTRPASYTARQVRGHDPWPGSFTRWRGRLLKIIAASETESQPQAAGGPGHVTPLPDGAGIVTGDGVLALSKLQLEGRRAVSAKEFVQGYRDFVGSMVGE